MNENKRDSDPTSIGGLPTEVRVEIAKHREELKEKKYNNTYDSPCFRIDKRVLEYITQTLIGIGIISFCSYQLTTADCSESSAYWSLLGSTVGFFLKSSLKQNNN